MLNVTVTCDNHLITGEKCDELFHCDAAPPDAPTTGPFLRSGWVQFMDGWTYRPDVTLGWLTLCPEHAEAEKP